MEGRTRPCFERKGSLSGAVGSARRLGKHCLMIPGCLALCTPALEQLISSEGKRAVGEGGGGLSVFGTQLAPARSEQDELQGEP